MSSDNMDARVTVDRDEFAAALNTLRRTVDTDQWRFAFIEYEGDCLLVYCGGNSVAVSTSGHWPGRVRISFDLLTRSGQALPSNDPLTLAVVDGTLRLGTLNLPCAWDTSGRPRIEIPLHPNLRSLLAISRRYDEEAIRQAGLEGWVGAAKDRLNEKIDRVSHYLENLGVTRDEVRELVERHLESANVPDHLVGPEQKELPLQSDDSKLSLDGD